MTVPHVSGLFPLKFGTQDGFLVDFIDMISQAKIVCMLRIWRRSQ
jgi:hypothetical protein